MKYVKTIGIALGVGLLSLATLELTLRALGFTSDLWLRQQAPAQPFLPDEFRIVCLGESTTFLGKENSYPSLLEKKLNQLLAPKRVRVFNLAQPGVSTNFFVERISEIIHLYQPHLVISMLGINDIWALHSRDFIPRQFDFLKVLKIYRLTELVYLHFRFPVPRSEALKNLESTEPQLRQFLNQSTFAEGMAKIESFEKNAKSLEEKKSAFFKKVRFLVKHNKFDQASTLLLEAMETGKFGERSGLAFIARELTEFGLPPNEKLFNTPNFLLRNFLTNPQTIENYRAISNLIVTHGITHLILQYPTLPLENLEKMFSPNHQRSFLSLETRFLEETKKHNFDELYTDNFGGSFGHFTPYSAEIIADLVADKIYHLLPFKDPK